MGLLRVQSRLQILSVRLPLALAPDQQRHGLSEGSTKEESDIVSKPSQTETISSLPQPTTRVSTHLSRHKLGRRNPKSLHSPHPLQ